jgi:hypothetical protein
MATTRKRLLVDEVRNGRFIRAWKERGEIVVQVWDGDKPEGESEHEWGMPGVLGLEACVDQAILQSRPKK